MEAKKICPFMSELGMHSWKEERPEELTLNLVKADCQEKYCALWVEGTEGQAGHCGMRK
jgi:hypothetical protein